jgi:hypothetical protein
LLEVTLPGSFETTSPAPSNSVFSNSGRSLKEDSGDVIRRVG